MCCRVDHLSGEALLPTCPRRARRRNAVSYKSYCHYLRFCDLRVTSRPRFCVRPTFRKPGRLGFDTRPGLGTSLVRWCPDNRNYTFTQSLAAFPSRDQALKWPEPLIMTLHMKLVANLRWRFNRLSAF